MTTFVNTHKRKFILGGVFVLLYFGFQSLGKDGGSPNSDASSDEVSKQPPAVVERRADLIKFGSWAPTDYREVLGEVESESDITVRAELNGTIASVAVEVGDTVRAGQVLARFKTSNDPTAINYQSALSNLETTQLSTQNSIRSAEIVVENAQKALAQTRAQQNQNYQQAYEALRLEAPAVMTTITTALDTIDRYVQFTNKYNFQDFSFAQIGNTDTIRRQNIKNEANQLNLRVSQLSPVSATASESQIVQDARNRLQILTSLQGLYDSLEILMERTSANSQITQAQINSYLAAVEGVHAALDGRVSGYKASIDRAEGAREQGRLAEINAQNGLESAQAGLELARSQAEAQIVGARNQVNIAGASTSNLVVRATISGTITDRTVRVGDLVNPGTPLFNIVNQEEEKKVTAFLSRDELRRAQAAEEIVVEIDGREVVVSDVFLSTQIDARTQKVLAEFTIPSGTTLVGNLATVKIPLRSEVGGVSNLVPFSAVSFEPDGAEVLIVGANNIAERRKVIVDRVVVSNVEILSGVEPEDYIVEFYKRVLPGERVVNDRLPIATETATESENIETKTEAETETEEVTS